MAQNQVDTLDGQLAVDTAAADAARVARAYNEIRAPFAGRTGVIGVREGSLVQPGSSTAAGAVLVTITQIDPITVVFTLPERELGRLQAALRAGTVPVDRDHAGRHRASSPARSPSSTTRSIPRAARSR